MRYWFQNLNEKKSKLFHFRGDVSSNDCNKRYLKYEFSSGLSLKFKYESDSCDGDMITLGLLFFTTYLTSPFFRIPLLTRGREYGFYFYDWAFVWSWANRPFESNSSDPWWMRQYIHLDDLILGKRERLESKILDIENIWFRVGDKEFKMDSIVWEKNRAFRRHIPFSLYHKTWYSVDMKIKDPPMYSGKGENSWDCGDDGSYGLSGPWKFTPPSWLSKEESSKQAIQYYVEHIMKSAKRYGGSSSERGIRSGLAWEYIGQRLTVEQT